MASAFVSATLLPGGSEVLLALLHARETHPAWVPVIGDPLCVAAGWLRIPWPLALLPITAGKTARYAALLALT